MVKKLILIGILLVFVSGSAFATDYEKQDEKTMLVRETITDQYSMAEINGQIYNLNARIAKYQTKLEKWEKLKSEAEKLGIE